MIKKLNGDLCHEILASKAQRRLAFNPQVIIDLWKKGVRKIKDTMEEFGMEFAQAHACSRSNYYFPLNTSKDEIKKNRTRSIEVCGELGIKNMVLHGQLSREKSVTLEERLKSTESICLKICPCVKSTG